MAYPIVCSNSTVCLRHNSPVRSNPERWHRIKSEMVKRTFISGSSNTDTSALMDEIKRWKFETDKSSLGYIAHIFRVHGRLNREADFDYFMQPRSG